MQHTSTCSCSRRGFLRGCGLTLAGFGLTSLFPTPFIQHAMAQAASTHRRLLFIFLRGGNDGINAVIPDGDPDYNTTHRPNLYIGPGSSLDLGNSFARLHPALGDMMEAYGAGDLAVMHRIGYQNSTRSHFDGQRIWENGDPSQPQLFEGWLYRYIQENAVSAGVDLPALTIQATAPLVLRGDETFVNVANPDAFGYFHAGTNPTKEAKYAAAWRRRYSNLVGLEPFRPVLSQTGIKLVDTLDEYESWDQGNWHPRDPNPPSNYLFPVDATTNEDQANPGTPLFSAESYPFFQSLKVAALSLLETAAGGNNNGTRIAGTQLNGFDLHDGQVAGGPENGRHAELLSWLGYGFRSLRIVLSGAATNEPRGYPSIWADTVVATLSEFGRTSSQNGSQGTDHAAASCLFMQGGSVNGGVYNCDPGSWPVGDGSGNGVMFGIDGRYLPEQTDYRAIFWELLRDHMGAASGGVEQVFPGYTSLNLGAQELGLIQP